MKKEKIINLKIGDNLYTFPSCHGVFKYTVKGIREYEFLKHYELECQSCSLTFHNNKCRILVVQNDNENTFKYVSMVDEENDSETYWHEQVKYFLTIEECKKHRYKQILYDYEKDISDLKSKLLDKEKRYNEIKSIIESL